MNKAVLSLVVLGMTAVNPAFASAADPHEGLALLSKMANASRQLNYSGTFVYQHGNQSETSRIVHYVNPAGGEIEKLETLDGPAREVIRNNDQITCYLPESKTVIIEQRNARQLPVLLPDRLVGIVENYAVRVTGVDRVAGYECNVVVLDPKDKMRYGRRFCAEVKSGLPLRSHIVNEKRETVEAFAFTQLTMGDPFNRDRIRSKYAAVSKNWRVDRSALSFSEKPADTGWVLGNQPPGFRKITEMKRSIAGRRGSVSHIVYSDGLAAISVFIEPVPRERLQPMLTHQGAVNIYTRMYSDHMVTVLGEAPAATVMQIANSIERKTPAADSAIRK
ncbi:MAG: MucB/RseB C-terminal domain-containing protein [Burkholderiales bacterium]|nr:MucB/RseB C-terminal domain-containing protein [Burkholderiales bacterium]